MDAPIADAPQVDALVDAGPPVQCDASPCHIDCFGGSECVDGRAWVNVYAPISCCGEYNPAVCGGAFHVCASGCGIPDPRYQTCASRLGTPSEPCFGARCEHLLLLCAEGAPKEEGAACAGDADCRPAAAGVTRLHCDGTTHLCSAMARPDPLPGYRASCGLTYQDVASLDGIEGLVSSPHCEDCQVYVHDGCVQQACTMPCTFDEDCPADAVCLCPQFAAPSAGYCAAGVTDRASNSGRGAGLPACSP